MPPQALAWLAYPVAGNSIQSYLIAAATFLVVLLAAYSARRLAIGRLERIAARTKTDLDNVLVGLLASIQHPEFFLIALYASTRGLVVHASLDRAIRLALLLTLSLRAVLIAQALARYGMRRYAEKEVSDPTARSAIANLQWIVIAALWILGGVLILDNMGVNVTALMTGLGIGGVAVALAAQAILGDLFSSFAIFMDKPFKVGDLIIVGDLAGTVENIGIKTTRVRSLQGEMLVFPNSDLTGSRIRNFGFMQRRRVVFQFGVVYQTPVEKLRKIPELVRQIATASPEVTVERIHFKAFGPSSLDFEAVYFIESPDYNVYMDNQQRINLALVEAFQKEGIDFAYPTQTLYVEKVASPTAKAA